ncbi:MAG: hypothetical protein P4L40_21565 [Terracidiphilus sp.]|nr:hypothetical protein [Terracidiphilus sp.]
MSWENVKDAYRTRLGNPAAKEVLALVVDEANAEGLAFVGLDRVVYLTEVKKRTVQRVLQVFEVIGLVSRTEAMLKGRVLPAFQVDLVKLGSDLRQPYAEAYSVAQKKPFGKRRSDAAGSVAATRGSVAATRGSVAATRGSVAATRGSVAATQPPHPHKGVSPFLPFVSPTPQPPQAGASELNLALELALDRATEQVMSALNVDGEQRRKRKLIRGALKRAAEKGELPATLALAMIEAVREQDRLHLDGQLKFKFGLQRFLGEGIWRDANRWAWDPATMRLQAEARMGS